jgi:hypothetical protein
LRLFVSKPCWPLVKYLTEAQKNFYVYQHFKQEGEIFPEEDLPLDLNLSTSARNKPLLRQHVLELIPEKMILDYPAMINSTNVVIFEDMDYCQKIYWIVSHNMRLDGIAILTQADNMPKMEEVSNRFVSFCRIQYPYGNL